jgi:hypothetical protein
MKKFEITLKKAVLFSFGLHAVTILIVILVSFIITYKKKSYESIEVAIVADNNELPSIAKKDIDKAVEKALGEKRAPVKEMEFQDDTLSRKNIIERLKKIHDIKKKLEKKAQGKSKGSPGIQGSTVAQVNNEGIQNPYIKKVVDIVKTNRFIIPNFEGDSPDLVTVILIKLNPDGTIYHIEILESSGNKIYDDLNWAAVKNSAPFGEVPDDYQKQFQEIGFGLRLKR